MHVVAYNLDLSCGFMCTFMWILDRLTTPAAGHDGRITRATKIIDSENKGRIPHICNPESNMFTSGDNSGSRHVYVYGFGFVF